MVSTLGISAYFSDVPQVVSTEGCLTVDGKALLYIGIAPDKASKPNSRQSLLHRIRYHYRGNAEGSTLRRTLGVLLEEKRNVGDGRGQAAGAVSGFDAVDELYAGD